MKIASFFAGVGGIELGFNQFQTIYANEIDPRATLTYEKNFEIKVDCRDILNVDEKSIPNFDILLGDFPCQAFSIAGYQLGFNDSRGNMLFELTRAIREKNPKVIFLENVKNLVSHDRGKTFLIMLDELKNLGYFLKYQVLNAMEYGNTPQNRERIYIVDFKNKKEYEKFSFPDPIPLTKKFKILLIMIKKLIANTITTKIILNIGSY